MADFPTSTRRPRRRRYRWLQLSLRTLLLATVLTSLGMWWFLRARPQETKLSGGYLVRSEVRSLEDAETAERREIQHGRVELVDQHGRVRVRGYLDRDRTAGEWTFYDPSGRRRQRGECEAGRRVGVWDSWHANGRKAAELSYGRALQLRKNVLVPFTAEARKRPQYAAATVVAVRDGPARTWWPNGRLRSEGNYRLDQRHGEWTFWDSGGRQREHGRFEEGVRQGEWEVWDEHVGGHVRCFYLDGECLPPLPRWIEQLTQFIEQGDPAVRIEAVREAGRLGHHGLPAIRSALHSPDLMVRRVALNFVVEMGESAQPLVADLEQSDAGESDADRFTRLLARFAAEPKSGEVAFGELLELVSAAPPRERVERQRSLNRLGQPAIELLEARLRRDDIPQRRQAFETLVVMFDPWYVWGFDMDPRIRPHHVRMAAILREAVKHPDPLIAEAAALVTEATGRRQAEGL